jgi:hypothetical protein
MFSMEVHGFDQLDKQFKQMEKAANKLDGTNEVPFGDLFPISFMRKYTSFSSMDELLIAGGFKVECQEDFEAIPDDVFDCHIAKTTKFKTWEDMLNEATSRYISQELRL